MHPETEHSSGELIVTLVDYLMVLVRFRKMIIMITVTTVLISVTYSFFATKIYSSTAKILPPQQDNTLAAGFIGQFGGMAGLAGNLFGGSTQSDLYVGMLQSETVSNAIIKQFKLREVYSTDTLSDTYEALGKKVKFEAGRKDGIISITVEDKDPTRAANMANAFIEELGRLAVNVNRQGAGPNRAFLEERLATAKTEMDRYSEELKRFQLHNKAIDVPEQARATIQSIAELRAKLAAQEVNLSFLRKQFTDNSYEVVSQRSAINNLKSQIEKLEGLGNGGALPSVGSVPALGQQYLRIIRELKVQEALVELLSKQYELNKLNELRNFNNLQILQKASIPDKRIKPKRTKIVLASTFGSILLAIVLAFIRESIARMSDFEKRRWLNLKDSILKN